MLVVILKVPESVQCRVMRVMFEDSDYTISLVGAELNPLESRHDQLTEHFFPAHCPARDIMLALHFTR